MIHTRPATVDDVPALEAARAPDEEAGPADRRMARYLRGEHHPGGALEPRALFLAEDQTRPVGYTGGHLTRRHRCDGELQYLYVTPALRRTGVASVLLADLWAWFRGQGARRICVDVEPTNLRARAFYAAHGATRLGSETHWMVWEDIG